MAIPDVQDSVVIQMPAWNALYQIRDFAHQISNLRATGATGTPLPVQRLDKQTWRIETPAGRGEVRVQYAIYWDRPGPFATQLNAQHAFLNLAMVLCYLPSRRAEDTRIDFAGIPAGWRLAVPLPAVSAAQGGGTSFTAVNYDDLVDAPVEIGSFVEFRFEVGGRPIRVVIHGDAVDRTRLTEMLSKIIAYQTRLMGDVPFPEYTFLYHVGRRFGGGGMEHADSTAISVESSDRMANITAHEFFHLWNVKRIRPQSLEPVDHTQEMFTRSLWFAEGVTNTYAAYTLVRTGLWSKARFLRDLGAQITTLRGRPAHLWQSAEESSLNAWFEKYDLYNKPEFSISYYTKGQLLGVALDITIRDATDNQVSLDDVLRRLNGQYAQKGRFYPESEGIREVAEEVIRVANPEATADLEEFFDRYVAGTDELPLAELLSRAGLALVERGRSRGRTAYSVVEIPQPDQRQQDILNGLLQGTTEVVPATVNAR